MGIEPTRPAWKAGILPLNYTRAPDLSRSIVVNHDGIYYNTSKSVCQHFFLFVFSSAALVRQRIRLYQTSPLLSMDFEKKMAENSDLHNLYKNIAQLSAVPPVFSKIPPLRLSAAGANSTGKLLQLIEKAL